MPSPLKEFVWRLVPPETRTIVKKELEATNERMDNVNERFKCLNWEPKLQHWILFTSKSDHWVISSIS